MTDEALPYFILFFNFFFMNISGSQLKSLSATVRPEPHCAQAETEAQ